MSKFFTYILYSPNFNKHYFGYTSDLQKRLFYHNSALSTYTKKYLPWELIYFEEFDSRTDAIKREKFFKSYQGYKWLKENNII
ncbi:GIY-YIG nuclease family protein [Ignavibacterium sp.]